MNFNAILAEATTPQTTAPVTTGAPKAGQQAPTISEALSHQLPFFILIGVMFYFILIRPQQKRAKELAKLVSSIKAGDKVATSSGIVGVVIAVKDTTMTIKSFDAKMEVTKASVTQILEGGTALAS